MRIFRENAKARQLVQELLKKATPFNPMTLREVLEHPDYVATGAPEHAARDEIRFLRDRLKSIVRVPVTKRKGSQFGYYWKQPEERVKAVSGIDEEQAIAMVEAVNNWNEPQGEAVLPEAGEHREPVNLDWVASPEKDRNPERADTATATIPVPPRGHKITIEVGSVKITIEGVE